MRCRLVLQELSFFRACYLYKCAQMLIHDSCFWCIFARIPTALCCCFIVSRIYCHRSWLDNKLQVLDTNDVLLSAVIMHPIIGYTVRTWGWDIHNHTSSCEEKMVVTRWTAGGTGRRLRSLETERGCHPKIFPGISKTKKCILMMAMVMVVVVVVVDVAKKHLTEPKCMNPTSYFN